MNLFFERKFLIEEKIFERISKIFLTSELDIKSKYLCLYLVSLLVSPCHFSGNGLKDFVKSSILVASNVNCLVLVKKHVPSTKIKSPMSINFLKKSNDSIPIVSFEIKT